MNPSKKKGSLFERQVADFLGTERTPLKGVNDMGDVFWGEWIVELKATQKIDLARALFEAKRAAINHGRRKYACVHKRRMASTEEAYVTMPLYLFKELTDGRTT